MEILLAVIGIMGAFVAVVALAYYMFVGWERTQRKGGAKT
jgi:hypothetical protein